MTALYQIDLPYGCFGICVDAYTDAVTDAAPMGKWMRGKKFGRVRGWVWSKGGKVELVAVESGVEDRD